MNKTIKVVMIIGVVFLAAGLVICGVTLPSVAGNLGRLAFWRDEPGELSCKDYQTINLADINTIRVVGDSLEVELESTPKEEMQIELASSDWDYYEYAIRQNMDVLEVQVNRRWRFRGGDPGRLILQIPETYQRNLDMDLDAVDLALWNLTLGDVHIEINAGNGRLNWLQCNRLSTEVDAGNIETQDSRVQQFITECNTGRVAFAGRAEQAEMEVNLGEIEASFLEAPRELSAQTNAGSMEINLPKEIPGFELAYEADMGELNCSFLKTPGRSGTVRYGDGSGRYRMQVNAGSIRVKGV